MINLIACVDKNNAIGNKGRLLTRLPKDMKRFRSLTLGNFIVMGSNTYREIGKPLDDRVNVVLTRDPNKIFDSNVFTYSSVESFMKEYKNHASDSDRVFICGGEEVYSSFLPYADYIYLTVVDHEFEQADRYFPTISPLNFTEIARIEHQKDEKHPYNYSFIKYKYTKM